MVLLSCSLPVTGNTQIIKDSYQEPEVVQVPS